jgi:hypothetical protein
MTEKYGQLQAKQTLYNIMDVPKSFAENKKQPIL